MISLDERHTFVAQISTSFFYTYFDTRSSGSSSGYRLFWLELWLRLICRLLVARSSVERQQATTMITSGRRRMMREGNLRSAHMRRKLINEAALFVRICISACVRARRKKALPYR